MSSRLSSFETSKKLESRILLQALHAIQRGDFSKRLPHHDLHGIDSQIASTFNAIAEQCQTIHVEFHNLSVAIGNEGQTKRRASRTGTHGGWANCIDSFNFVIDEITRHQDDIIKAIVAVNKGDLSQSIEIDTDTYPTKGAFLRNANTVNTMLLQLNTTANEIIRVVRNVGAEGILSDKVNIPDARGAWRDLSLEINHMSAHLSAQNKGIDEVISAISRGDLSKNILVNTKGKTQQLQTAINDLVKTLDLITFETNRVLHGVSVEGHLGQQIELPDLTGVWRKTITNINRMSLTLKEQVRNVTKVTAAVANGDLSKTITIDAKGDFLQLKNTANFMVQSLNTFGSEVTRIARNVGTGADLGGQAVVRDVSGVWKNVTDSVNFMANNFTSQVRNIAEVARAVAAGDLSKKITVHARGEILDLKNIINSMVDQLNAFGAEVTQLARDVGVEGKLGGQAQVEGVQGLWKELTNNVNLMALNLTHQVRDIAGVTTSVANGDLTRKIVVDAKGEILELKNTINTMVEQLSSFAHEVTRVARDVGVEGKLGGQAEVRGVAGTWQDLTNSVNLMVSNLTDQVRDIAVVTTAVAQGDLSKKITIEVKGELLELKNTINTMVDLLSSFGDEVIRVAREVGTMGILGGQAEVQGVSGSWRDLTDNVNLMAGNLTEQVRGIAQVVTAAAQGDLSQKLSLNAKGEIATLVDTINNMLVTLSVFVEQVSGVARDVGVKGKLGGQADVPGAAGVWRDLTNNVNELAGNLTSQVRAIGDVATAVTQGDLTQSIEVQARGEVALLKDNINQMIRSLSKTTAINREQDWLKTNLTTFTRMLQGQRDLSSVAQRVMIELAPVVNAQYGAFYLANNKEDSEELRLFATYASTEHNRMKTRFKFGEGLVGQCGLEKKINLISDAPLNYIRIYSGLGEATPTNIIIVPILFEGETRGVVELASFTPFTEVTISFLKQLAESLGIGIATIEAQMRTNELLKESQSLTEELQAQQEELRQSNEELEEKAIQLSEQKSAVEQKNREVEEARSQLEEKAEQLSLTSKYKSEFLANMSHELRTPLNSLLILSRQLAENQDGNLSAKQCQYARTIHDSGNDLLSLINEILDLAKIESGTILLERSHVEINKLIEYLGNTFSNLAADKRLDFHINQDTLLPSSIITDQKRLLQILRNLLSNAFKFTEHGSVSLDIRTVRQPRLVSSRFDTPDSTQAMQAIAFSVQDTGIGISTEKQNLIFEAFQQADSGNGRRYSGTGLGLSISRELADLLGGEIQVYSKPNEGSCFTLYLPIEDCSISDQHLGSFHTNSSPIPFSPNKYSYDTSNAFAAHRILPPDLQPQIVANQQLATPSLVHPQTTESDEFDPSRTTDSTGFAENQAKSHQATPSKDPQLYGKTILVVDDDIRNIFAITSILEYHEATVIHAESGESGIAKLQNTPQVSVILMDIMMPGMNGYQAIRRIRGQQKYESLPIIALTAKAMKGDHEACIEAGASDYITKPLDSDQLISRLKEWLQRYQGTGG